MERLSFELSDFFDLLDHTQKDVWSDNAPEGYEERLAHAVERIGRSILIAGDQHQLLLDSTNDSLPAYFFLYRWAEQAKHYLTLWRDTLFQHQKAVVFSQEGLVDKESLRELWEASKSTIAAATEDLLAFPDQEQKRSLEKGQGWDRQVEGWQRQHNPWPIYREQVQQLMDQAADLRLHQEQTLQAANSMTDVRELVRRQLDTCEVELYQLEAQARKTATFIREQAEGKAGRMVAHLKETAEALITENHLIAFSTALENQEEAVPKQLSVPIDLDGGLIQIREVNLQRSTQQWIDSQIIPSLYDIWEILDAAGNNLRITLINIQNRIILLSGDKTDYSLADSQEDVARPLDAFLEKMTDWKENLRNRRQESDERLTDTFQFHTLYAAPDFLAVPLQSSINQYRIGQDEVFGQFRQLIGRPIRWLSRFWRSVEAEESLSLSEKIVRFIEHNTSAPETAHYTHIFLTKGYIGESFRVGRKEEMARIEKLIRQWRAGFRGAVVLSGQRLSGKTLFGELVANRFFPFDTVRVQPNTIIDIDGRKVEPGYDLKKALDFVAKHTLNKKTLIWIDDLELWNDPDTPLQSEVKDLLRTIDQYASRMFFMVSMSNWMKARLSKVHQIDRVFQAEINLDTMSKEEIRKAILIRHGATHQELVDADGEPLTSQEFDRYLSAIYRAANGNIGEALNTWANRIYLLDETKVACRRHFQYNLPDFLTPESAVILASVMLDRRTNQYRLRKLYGPRFKDKYNLVVQRLLSVGILRRDLDGWLEIEEAAVNEVGQLLAKHDYLQFNS